METKSLNSPDEVGKFEKGRLELVSIGGTIVGRGVFEPGSKWPKHVKPIAKTNSCEAPLSVGRIRHSTCSDG